MTAAVSFLQQLKAIQHHIHVVATPGPLRPGLREVPSLIYWIYCFTAYVSVMTSEQLTRDLLVYC